MKKYLITLASLLLICSACTSKAEENNVKMAKNKEFYSAYESIPKDKIYKIQSEAELAINISDSNLLYQNSQSVVLAQVESIEGSDTYNEQGNYYMYPYTYGSLKVLNVYKGDLVVNESYPYVRMGGIVPFEDYKASLNPEQLDKMLYMMEGNFSEYVECYLGNDIGLEAGSTYLMYINGTGDDLTKIPHKGALQLYGWEGGLREVEQGSKARSANPKVFNNITGEWEELGEVLPKEK